MAACRGYLLKTLPRENELFQKFKGAIVENCIAQALVHKNYSLYYWASEGKAKIDFFIEQDGFVYPIELKSGNSPKKKSLRV